jgi:hypothetical protein
MKTWPDGREYNGSFANGKANGIGIENFPDGRKYSGGFKDGLRSGSGKETGPDEVSSYEGDYLSGEKSGKGT